MFKKIINFLDKHRLILALSMLLSLTIIFFLISICIFLNYNFKPLECTKNIDDSLCFHDNTEILKNPESTKETIFKAYSSEISLLIKNYNLPEFNNYS